MTTFTIENETNNITIHATLKEAKAVLNAELFQDEESLGKLAAIWPTSRLAEIWNSLPGASPVRKFTDRKTGVSRIWKAIQSLAASVPTEFAEAELPEAESTVEPEPGPVTESATETQELPTCDTDVTPQSPDVAPKATPAKTKASPAKKAPAAGTTGPREGSKTSQVIAMLRREGGTTLEEIVTATGWQKHTTRAMLSAGGSLTKNHGLAIVSEKAGEKRVYSIIK